MSTTFLVFCLYLTDEPIFTLSSENIDFHFLIAFLSSEIIYLPGECSRVPPRSAAWIMVQMGCPISPLFDNWQMVLNSSGGINNLFSLLVSPSKFLSIPSVLLESLEKDYFRILHFPPAGIEGRILFFTFLFFTFFFFLFIAIISRCICYSFAIIFDSICYIFAISPPFSRPFFPASAFFLLCSSLISILCLKLSE